MGRNGDLPNDIKFQYGGVVLRGAAIGQPQYAIYGSLFVLVPDDDPRGGTRTFPPFQGNGGGPSGGPIITVRGRPIDLFIHLTGVRPGSVLEVGDTFGVSGAVGPPLPAVVSYTVTKPSGQQLSFNGRANRVGYYYRGRDDFVVDQPGLWQVDLRVDFDGVTSAGPVRAPFPTGGVLGTANGRLFVYVVERGSVALGVSLPRDTFLSPPAALDVSATVPPGTTVRRAQVTTSMPGFVLEASDLTPGTGLAYRYDSVALARDYPNLDVTYFGSPEAADLITISLFASGTGAGGAPVHAARVVALHGTELLNLPVAASLLPLLDVTTDRASYQRAQALTLSVHYSQGTPTEPLDAYVGLRRPDGSFESLQSRAGRFELTPTGATVTPAVQGALPRLEFSGPLATRAWTAADPAGTWTAFAVLVRAGLSPLNPANWVGVKTGSFTLAP